MGSISTVSRYGGAAVCLTVSPNTTISDKDKDTNDLDSWSRWSRGEETGRETGLTITNLVRVVFLNELVIPTVKVAYLNSGFVAGPHAARMPDALEVVFGLERFFKVGLVQSQEGSRVVVLGGGGKVVSFLVECRSLGRLTIDQVW